MKKKVIVFGMVASIFCFFYPEYELSRYRGRASLFHDKLYLHTSISRLSTKERVIFEKDGLKYVSTGHVNSKARVNYKQLGIELLFVGILTGLAFVLVSLKSRKCKTVKKCERKFSVSSPGQTSDWEDEKINP